MKIQSSSALLCLLIALVLSGCNSYYQNGIGAGITHRQANDSTLRTRRDYFNFLCRDAGLRREDYGVLPPDCILEPYDAQVWTLITEQGINDIDRRCDAYLLWLDARRKSRGPLLAQVATTGAATAGIMGVAGASTEALSIVAIAFGIVSQSIENYYSRLLFEVEGSTVTTIVMHSRREFQDQLAKQYAEGKRVQSKPEAERVLRQYLRLCMPFVIEAKINQFATLGTLGIEATSLNSLREEPAILQGRAGTAPATADDRIDRDTDRQARDNVVPGARTDIEKRLADRDMREIQARLCVTEDGKLGPETRANIMLWEEFKGNRYNGNGQIDTESERVGLLSATGCDGTARNMFEQSLPEQIWGLVANKLRDRGATLTENEPTIDMVRAAVSDLKTNDEQFEGTERDYFADELTPALLNELGLSREG